jgi:thiol-disulfide isomerase/thioredoxin
MTAPGDVDDEAPPRPGRRPLDARTVLVCAGIALLAAVLAGLLVSRVAGDDGDDDGGPGLVAAEEVPDIALDRLDGEGQLSLADYRGQAVVVNFWGSWCGPCVDEMPDLQRVHASLGDDVAFVGVNVRDQRDNALELVEQTGVTYDLATDTDGALVRVLGVTTFPTTLIVLPDGSIADASYTALSPERLCQKLNLTVFAGGLETCG